MRLKRTWPKLTLADPCATLHSCGLPPLTQDATFPLAKRLKAYATIERVKLQLYKVKVWLWRQE